ncbi:hypothetical protein C8R45DRAFT_937197 [Mycena sanguinolenta]|nr:hypothetical protein C8R45DRAFT_937197 [Mycena sanguinolenta]
MHPFKRSNAERSAPAGTEYKKFPVGNQVAQEQPVRLGLGPWLEVINLVFLCAYLQLLVVAIFGIYKASTLKRMRSNTEWSNAEWSTPALSTAPDTPRNAHQQERPVRLGLGPSWDHHQLKEVLFSGSSLRSALQKKVRVGQGFETAGFGSGSALSVRSEVTFPAPKLQILAGREAGWRLSR